MSAVTAPSQTPRARRRGRGQRVARLVAAIAVTLVMFFPLYWMVVTAFSTRQSLYAPGLHLWPSQFTFDNFVTPIRAFPVWHWFRNSVVIAVLVTAITAVVNLLAGYAFAKLPFRGRNVLFLLLLSTMMIPIQAIMVPQFDLVIDLGLYGTIWAVVLPTSAAVFGIFLARQFFLSIPDELLEAARVDGASQLRTFLQVVLPLSKPLVAVLVLLTFSAEWNDFAWPLVVFFSSNELFTLPLGLVTDLKGQYGTNYGALMAMTLLTLAPVIILFLAFQRYFVAGFARSGIR
ncbi:carbohydrate ABC transporter permease [Angustibacter aerolatus]